MVKMTIKEYWNCLGIPRGEFKDRVSYPNSGYASVKDAVKELSGRFKHRLAYAGRNEVVFEEKLLVQVISFE